MPFHRQLPRGKATSFHAIAYSLVGTSLRSAQFRGGPKRVLMCHVRKQCPNREPNKLAKERFDVGRLPAV
ncbi:hypothetical protein EVAR_11477_1 [Eumeta japonica]|uniref:Uncharacterized protein n=1 Tax=Eumeta variegata TaxID=151549 RepID=A0A4C1TZX4_EUMVA|nr:hypothetical protein EVAR_11477_1 [Eumeta japonica]